MRELIGPSDHKRFEESAAPITPLSMREDRRFVWREWGVRSSLSLTKAITLIALFVPSDAVQAAFGAER